MSTLKDKNFGPVPPFEVHTAIGPNIGQEEPKPIVTEWFDLNSLISFDRDTDPDSLIGNRWLGRGDSAILQGYTGFVRAR